MPVDTQTLIMGFIVAMFVPILLWSFWQATRRSFDMRDSTPLPELPPPLPTMPQPSIGMLMREMPDLQRFCHAASELELRLLRCYVDAKSHEDREKYKHAALALREVTPEITREGAREVYRSWK